MDVTSCAHCGAPDPGRFCAGCGRQNVPPQAAVQEPADSPDDGATRIAREPSQNWQPLPTLSGAPAGDPTVLGQVPPYAGQYGHASIGQTSTPPYTAPPIVVAYPEAPRRSKAPAVVATAALLVAACAGTWWVAGRRADATTVSAAASTPAAAVATPSVTASTPPRPTAPATSAAPEQAPSPMPTRTQAPVAPQQPLRPATPTSPTTPTDDPGDDDGINPNEAKAEQALRERRAIDVQHFDPQPHVIVQVTAGRTFDPSRKTQLKGTSTYRKILATHERVRRQVPEVLLIRGTDVGSTNEYQKDWLTIYDPGFRSEAEGNAWCKRNGLIGNGCYASDMRPDRKVDRP